MSKIDTSKLTVEEKIALIESLRPEVREAKRIERAANKYKHLEPHYSEYLKQQKVVKESKNELKRLLDLLKSKGYRSGGKAKNAKAVRKSK